MSQDMNESEAERRRRIALEMKKAMGGVDDDEEEELSQLRKRKEMRVAFGNSKK